MEKKEVSKTRVYRFTTKITYFCFLEKGYRHCYNIFITPIRKKMEQKDESTELVRKAILQ